MLDVLVRTQTTVERMARASRARASATTGTPEKCVSITTTLVRQFTVSTELTVAATRAHVGASVPIDTQGRHANKPPNHVVQNQASAAWTPSARAAATATPRAAPTPVATLRGVTPTTLSGTTVAIGHADASAYDQCGKGATWLW